MGELPRADCHQHPFGGTLFQGRDGRWEGNEVSELSGWGGYEVWEGGARGSYKQEKSMKGPADKLASMLLESGRTYHQGDTHTDTRNYIWMLDGHHFVFSFESF